MMSVSAAGTVAGTEVTGKTSDRKKNVKIAAPRDVASVVSSPTPTMAGHGHTFSDVFWELMFTVTGFRKAHIARLKETDEATEPTHNVVELVMRDLSWTDAATIHRIREGLQEYVGALRALKAENAKQVRTRPFVDQKRYEALRSREAASRVTLQSIAASFTSLDFSSRKISSLSESSQEDLNGFKNLQRLTVSRNSLGCVSALPPALTVLVASGSGVTDIAAGVLERMRSLYVLGLSSNPIRDVSFLLSSVTVVAVDLSYTLLTDLRHIIDVVCGHPTLKDLNLTGCPVTLVPRYREILLGACRNLRTLDGAVVAAVEDTPIKSPRSVSTLSLEAIASGDPVVYVTVAALRGASSLVPPPEDNARAMSAGKKAAPPSAKKGAVKVEEVLGPSLQTSFSLNGVWADGALRIAVSDFDLLPPALSAEDPKAAAKPAPKKGGAAPAAEVITQQPLSTFDDLPVRVTAKAPLPLQQLDDVHGLMTQPLVVSLDVSEFIVTPAPASAPAPSSPTRSLTSSVYLGAFVVGLYDALLTLTAGATRTEVVVPLRPQADAVARATALLQQKRNTLREMMNEDAALDAALAEQVAVEQALPTEITQAAAPAKGGKAPAAKPAAAKPLSDATVARQQESAQRKTVIEELAAALKDEEKRIARFRDAKVSLVLHVGLNAPLEAEKVAEVTTAAPPASSPAKKK